MVLWAILICIYVRSIHTLNLFNIFYKLYLSLYLTLFHFSTKFNSANLKWKKIYILQNVCVKLSFEPEIVLFVINWNTYFYFGSLSDLNLNLYIVLPYAIRLFHKIQFGKSKMKKDLHTPKCLCKISFEPEIVLFVINWKTYFYFCSLNGLNLNLYTSHSYFILIQYLL